MDISVTTPDNKPLSGKNDTNVDKCIEFVHKLLDKRKASKGKDRSKIIIKK